MCHRCADEKAARNAKYKCLQCKDSLCSECAQNHMILRPCLDFRIIDLRNGQPVDSVFSIEPDNDGLKNENIKSDQNSMEYSDTRFQVVRTFGKPVLQLTMQNKIQIPLTPASQSSRPMKQFSSNDTDNKLRNDEIMTTVETGVQSGDFNENGDFFPNSKTGDQLVTKPSILKRTTSFKSAKSDSLWTVEKVSRDSQTVLAHTQQTSKSQPPKKEVRFNTSMNTVTEEPNGILREYSNNFYHILGKQNSKKITEPPAKHVSQLLAKTKTKRNIVTSLSMVSQCSIVIGPQEIAGKISAALLLNDNYLIMVDRVNNKMKVFDIRDRYKFVIDKKIPKGSWGLASPEDNIIAMTCRNKIIFYGLFEIKTPRYEESPDPLLRPLDVEYRVRASCYGISFCESRDIFCVACNIFFSDPCIFIIDTKGHTQHILRTIDDGISSAIPFSETLKVDSDRGVLYVGDRFGKRVVCATYEGKHIWTVQLAGKPVSMTMDRDHIYVCVNGRTISLLHKDGRFIKNLINLDLDGRRICYHESSNQLVVLTKAFWGVSHFIQIYQL
jgi:hypothetical protein